MKALRRAGWVSVLAAAWVVLAGTSAPGQVLEQVPDNAQVVYKFKNLQGLSTKTAGLAKRLGLAESNPWIERPFDFMLIAWLGIANGLDKNGDMAIVFLNAKDCLPTVRVVREGEPEPPAPLVLYLVPITDYQVLLGNYAQKKKDGELDVVHLDNPGRPAPAADIFVTQWGKYAVFAPDKEALKKVPPLKISDALRKEMDAKDVSIYVNVKTLSAIALPMLQQNRAMILEQIAAEMKQGGAEEAKLTPVMQAAAGQVLAAGEHFLGECGGAVISGNLGDEGINLAAVVDFRADSYLGKIALGMHNVEGSFTAGLPEAKYVAYGGGSVNPVQAVQVIDDALGPIVAELNKAFPSNTKSAMDYISGLHEAVGSTQTQAIGVLAPAGQLGEVSLVQLVNVINGDAGKIIEGQKTTTAAKAELMKLFAGALVLPFSDNFAADAKTIAGVSFSKVEANIHVAPNTPEVAAAMAVGQQPSVFHMIYGAGGISGLFGKVDDKHVLVGVNVDDATMATAVGAIKENADALAQRAGMQMVNKNLPARRAGAGYVCADVLLGTIMDYARKAGEPVPAMQFKANMAPVGITVGSEQSAYRVDCFVPSEEVEDLVMPYLGVGK